MLGVLLSRLLGIRRMLLAMARRGDLPRRRDHVHPRHALPDHALVLTGGGLKRFLAGPESQAGGARQSRAVAQRRLGHGH
jgi:hypothetical protein